MGKNRKAKQVVNQAEIHSDDDGYRNKEVPIDFLTSDDFQVVQKKKHHSKKSPDEDIIPRSRSISERFADEDEDIFGCHSGFWRARSQSTEDTAFEVALAENKSSKVHASKNKAALTKLLSTDILTFTTENELCSPNGNGSRVDPDGADFGDPSFHLQLEKETLQTCAKDDLRSPSNNLRLQGEAVEDCGKSELLSKGFESGDDGKETSLKCAEKESGSGHKIEEISSIASDVEVLEKPVSSLPEGVDNGNENSSNATGDSKISDVLQNTEGVSKTTTLKKKDKKSKGKQKTDEKVEQGSCPESKTVVTDTKNPRTLVHSSSSECPETVSQVKCSEKQKEESGKRDRKRPSKKQLEAIHEALRKAKEEEERLKREEEAKRKLAEEAERQAQERLRLEQEKKEKKKLKEKQKKEKLRAEGRLLSKSQKQSRARMEASLEALRKQGVDVPQIGEKRPHRPRLGSYKDTHRKRLDSTQSDTSQVNKSERHKSESLSSQESCKESLSDLPSSFDSKDSWDLNAVIGSMLTSESDGAHLSCSEESDEEHLSNAAPSAKEVAASKLKDSVSELNLAKLKTSCVKVVEDKKEALKLRSPVVCVLGHVDTGKTKLLDYIRKTHVQDSEAGGITQQIGATMIPRDALKEKCKMVKDFSSFEMNVPGLLVIDTPGHESFSNLRSRGASICDIAILVVDIMHGLEPQTLESINLLKMAKIPFIVALNKIDRVYGWKSAKDNDIGDTVNVQSQITLQEFKRRSQEVILQFANECLNAALYYENKDPRTFVSMVPTSAITGDGMGNLLSLITQLTQSLMHKKLIFTQELQATVLEVKVISGLGTTIDVILVNGRLQEGDTIVLAGHEGPIVTQIRSLLMPQPLKELRVKNPYIEYKAVEGAQGVKITGKELDKSIAGLPLFVAQNPNKVDALKAEVIALLENTVSFIKPSERGVYVQASTLGSLEALLEHLTSVGIPYFAVKVGPVVRKDVMKASIMLEHDVQYATILAFDVKIERDAQESADSLGVKVIHANIIYHLVDAFFKHREAVLKKRDEARHLAVFPCILRLLAQRSITAGDSMLFNVTVEAGTLRKGTPLCVPTRGNLDLGIVDSIELDGTSVNSAKEGDEVCIKVDGDLGESPKVTQFDQEDYFISRVTRQSIDICKEHCRDELDPSDWNLMSELKKMLHAHV